MLKDVILLFYFRKITQLVRVPSLYLGGRGFKSYFSYHVMCPGGEGAVLKTVGRKRFAGSNPVHNAMLAYSSG